MPDTWCSPNRAKQFHGFSAPPMHDLHEQLLNAVVILGTARRLRDHELRRWRLLKESGKDVSAMQAGLEESKRFIQQISLQRKELGEKLLKEKTPAPDRRPRRQRKHGEL